MVRIQIIDVAGISFPPFETPRNGDTVVLHGWAGSNQAAHELAVRLAATTRVVVLFPPDDPPDIATLLSVGVTAVFPQSAAVAELVPLLTAGLDGTGPVADGGLPTVAAVPGTGRPVSLPALSRRENEVLELVARGHTHQQIARRLKISIHTVDTYVRRIKEKWKLGNKADLTRAAMPMMGDVAKTMAPAEAVGNAIVAGFGRGGVTGRSGEAAA